MKAKGKLIGLLTALLCIVPMMTGLFGLGDSASAAEPSTVDVTLHKKKMDEFPTGGIKNTGELMEGDDQFGKYDPLPGVEFKVYDVTTDFYRELNATGNETDPVYEANVKELMETFSLSKVNSPVVLDTQVTNDEGLAKFADLPDRDENGTYKVYLFVETDNPANTEFGQPVILMLPLYKADKTTPITDIHLYPKNQVDNKPTKEVVDDEGIRLPDADRHSYDVGKKINYKATFMMPSQIGEIIKNPDGTEKQTRYSKLVFKDEIDKDGVRFEAIDKILIGGKKVEVDDFTNILYSNTQYFNKGNDYLPTGKRAGFEIAMKLSDATSGVPFSTSKAVAQYLEQYRGQKIEIFYSVTLTEDTEVDVDINNDFSVTLKQHDKQEDKKHVDDKPVVTTGGKKFKKHEKDHENQGLKGAEFIVIQEDSNGNKLYLKDEANKRTWLPYTTGQNPSDAFKVTSDKDGLFEIKGLEYGDYSLVEVKAPNGFQKLDGPFDFTIDKDSYLGVDALDGGMVANTTKGGFLPSTGGMGIVIFLLIGGALMAFAVTRYRKTQHAA